MAPDVATKTSIVTLLAFLLVMVTATTVDITQEWKPNFGWEITCSWNLYANDSLQSVKLSKNRQQFMIFRPENLNKKQSWYLVENVMNVECVEDDRSGVNGKCVLMLEPQLPPKKDFTFGCEVSGERPYFREDMKEIFVESLIPPSDTEITVTRYESGTVSLNCTASGLPAPTIMWTVNDERVPHNFHGTPTWNATSKLWRVWSTFDPQPEDLNDIRCTPEVYKGRQVIRGESITYSDAPSKITISIDGALCGESEALVSLRAARLLLSTARALLMPSLSTRARWRTNSNSGASAVVTEPSTHKDVFYKTFPNSKT